MCRINNSGPELIASNYLEYREIRQFSNNDGTVTQSVRKGLLNIPRNVAIYATFYYFNLKWQKQNV